MIHSHMILTLDNTTWFFVIVFNPFYVCFEPFGFRFHTLYDLIMSREIPYPVEGVMPQAHSLKIQKVLKLTCHMCSN
jgi:hypothetical protein